VSVGLGKGLFVSETTDLDPVWLNVLDEFTKGLAAMCREVASLHIAVYDLRRDGEWRHSDSKEVFEQSAKQATAALWGTIHTYSLSALTALHAAHPGDNDQPVALLQEKARHLSVTVRSCIVALNTVYLAMSWDRPAMMKVEDLTSKMFPNLLLEEVDRVGQFVVDAKLQSIDIKTLLSLAERVALGETL
jgi:hypothetical protein